MGWRRDEPAPTIGALMTGTGWVWAHCTNGGGPPPGCGYARPITLARFAILWGMQASTDLIRERLKCSRCGGVGVQLIRPSMNALGEPAPYPADTAA